jgi:hypothetical protein
MTTNNRVLALAQYAYTRLEPLFARAKEVEPSIMFTIELVFADEESAYARESHLLINAHWIRKGMFQHSDQLQTQPDVDQFAAKVFEAVEALTAGVAA